MKIGAAILLIGFHLAKVAFSQEEEPLGYEKRELGRLLADGGVLTEDDKQALLEVHNTYRSNTALGSTGSQPMATDMLEMVWDENLAISSKEHVDKCVFEHSDTGGLYGENIYTAASSIDNVDNIGKLKSGVKKWYDEHAAYDYVGNDCSGVCGHYTQVVWSSSASVGCGYAECGPFADDLFEVMLVCQYSPPGNWVGEKPYTSTDNSADIASQCPVELYGDSASGLCKKPPTSSPNETPRSSPTASPTSSPTKYPTSIPTASPTSSPTEYPTSSPIQSPSLIPPVNIMRIKKLKMKHKEKNGKFVPRVQVNVVDSSKNGVEGVLIQMAATSMNIPHFEIPMGKKVTNYNGSATIKFKPQNLGDVVKLNSIDVTRDGYVYFNKRNVKSDNCIGEKKRVFTKKCRELLTSMADIY